MASLWEIMDPSNLEYNTDLGYKREDSGAGPPSASGWVRTGSDSWSNVGVGYDNCEVWNIDTGYGSGAYLPADWTGGLEDLHVWAVGRYQCGIAKSVWCVEDYPSFNYLPLVLRH
jgi:hypothetical protein